MKNSRVKGAAGEREWAGFCREQGYDDVRRTAQYCGNTGDASDCVGLPGIHQEVKRVERLNIYDALAQAIHDSEVAGKGDFPTVIHRRNDHPWLVTMRAEEWFCLYREWEAGGCPQTIIGDGPKRRFEEQRVKFPTKATKIKNRRRPSKSET